MTNDLPSDDELYEPVSGWRVLHRSAFTTAYDGHTWTVAVDFFDLDERLLLYRDGVLAQTQRRSARFVLPDGAEISARTSTFGMRHVRLTTPDGARWDVPPAPGTAEAWRARMHEEHPTASRAVAATAWTVLVVALVTQVPRLLDVLGMWVDGVPSFALALPSPVNTALQVGGVLAAVDRALRLRYTPWLDD